MYSSSNTQSSRRRRLSLMGLAAALTACVSVAQAQNVREVPVFPKKAAPPAMPRPRNVEGAVQTLSGTPDYAWWYGCSPTAAGMIIGWWDGRPGCGDMFEGSAATWYGNGSSGTKRMVASQQHIDAGKALGLTYGSYQNHTANSLADFMYTEDGGTYRSDIGPGMVAFCAWNDPTTATNENYTATYSTKYVSSGWTYAQFCAEIDAGRPVHLGLRNSSGVGHSVTAIGYDNTAGKQDYICYTTWSGWGLRSWGWTGEAQSGYVFAVYGATYLTVTPRATNQAPTAPTAVAVSPSSPLTADNLTASASGSTDSDGDTVSYQYQWAKSTDDGSTWSAWGYDGAALANANTTKNDRWKARARASDGVDYSAWVESASVTIGNTGPSAPSAVAVSPGSPLTTDDLAASASGATDADGDSLSYEVQWAKSADGGSTWGAWGYDGATLASSQTSKGEQWKARARANDGTTTGNWTESSAVAVGNTAPSTPSSVALSPASPLTDHDLAASPAGATDADGDGLGYEVQWAKSVDDGATWSAWGYDGATLASSLTSKGEQWKTRARASDGQDYSDWTESSLVTIGNTGPAAAATVGITPASPQVATDLTAAAAGATDADGDSLSYEYQWAESVDGGATWSGWNWSGATLAAANLAKGEQWKARARASDGAANGDWLESAAVTVGNSLPAAPAGVTVTPRKPYTVDDLKATVAAATDPDSDPLTYRYAWHKSVDGGATWEAGPCVRILAADQTTKGEQWKCAARAHDGSGVGPWTYSEPVTITNSKPSVPTAVTISPASPADGQNLRAAAGGGTDADGDALTYRYQWHVSADGGTTWTPGPAAVNVAASLTTPGELWKVAARASDGTAVSAWVYSEPVQIRSAEVRPSSLAVSATAATTRSQSVAVAVNLSAAAAVEGAVLNLAGREVGVIAPASLPAGPNTVWWNGRTATGTRAPGGQYLLRLTARGADGSCASCVVPLVR